MATLNAKYEHIRTEIEGLQRYIEFGTPTGSFLRAVLNSDLRSAYALADPDNKGFLPLIVYFCEANLPGAAWGTVAAVDDWLSMSQEERHEIVTTSRWYRAAELLSDTQAKQRELADQEPGSTLPVSNPARPTCL